jgi:hypothetical protein
VNGKFGGNYVPMIMLFAETWSTCKTPRFEGNFRNTKIKIQNKKKEDWFFFFEFLSLNFETFIFSHFKTHKFYLKKQ